MICIAAPTSTNGSSSLAAGKPTWGTTGATSPAATSPRAAAITQVFQMPFEQQRKRDSSDKRSLAEVCSTIGKETGTVIEASRSGQTLAYTFVIKGAEALIPVARRRLWSVLADTISIALPVPEECLGLIIGPGGRNVKALMELTSTKIGIPKPYEGQVLLSGDLEGISLAKQRIESLVRDRISKATKSLSLERHLLPFVLGRSPSTRLAAIFDDFSAAYDVKASHHGGRADADHVDLVISGDKDKVEAALAYLEERIANCRKSIKSVATTVPKALHRVLIGPKGDSLHTLQDEAGCSIVIPPPEDPSNSITVYGPEANLLKGLQGILEKTGSLDSQQIPLQEDTKSLLLHLHRGLVRELESKYGNVHVAIDAEQILVDGGKAEVALSVMEIKDRLSALFAYKFCRVEVGAEYMPHIVGKQHRSLEALESSLGVILVAGADSILIAAEQAASLDGARQALQKRVQELASMGSAVLKIEARLHAGLIGAKGASIKKIREEHPSVLVEFVSGKDEVRLRGPSDDVQAVKTILLREAEAIKHELIMNSHLVEVPLSDELFKAAVDGSKRLKSNPAILNIARHHKVKLAVAKDKPCVTVQGQKPEAEAAAAKVAQEIRKIADRGSETLEVDPAFHGLLIGKSGKNVKHFRQKYDITLDIPQQGATENGSVITISGPRASLKEAKEEILEFIEYEKAHRHQDTIKVPEEAVPMILGKGGSRLNEIRALEGVTRIDLERSLVVEGMVAISLEGSEAGIIGAKKAIESVLDEYRSTAREIVSPGKEAFERLTGAGQALLQGLVGECGAKGVQVIVLNFEHQIIIRGKKDAVAEAKGQLDQLLCQKFVKRSISIPAKFHGSIVGSKGGTINGLQARHNVAIYLPNSMRRAETPVSDDSVLVEGRPEDVDAACEKLLSFVVESQTIPMPNAFRSQVAGSTRERLKELSVRAFEAPEGLKIVGPEEKLGEAARLVQAAVDELATRFCVEAISVPVSQHRLIIGKGGAQIEALRKETGCKISIPPAYLRSDQVEVQGSPEAVRKAIEAIRNLTLSPGA